MNDGTRRISKLALSDPVKLEHLGYQVISGNSDSREHVGSAILRAAQTIKTYERLLKDHNISIPKRTD